MASTLGVVIPPSLVLILIGDAMMRAHTEALNITRQSMRIVNTQDVFVGALAPAGVLLLLGIALTWWIASRDLRGTECSPAPPSTRDRIVASLTVALIVVLRALFALLVAATVFTLVLRAYGTDRWFATVLARLQWGEYPTLLLILLVLALCALVLDAFEMIFVVVPVVMPPLLTLVHNVTWVAVLTLLILQASFLLPPFGYAVLMVRNSLKRHVAVGRLARALLPYLIAQLAVLALVLAEPGLVWQRNPIELKPGGVAPKSEQEEREMLEQQLDQQLQEILPDGEESKPPSTGTQPQ